MTSLSVLSAWTTWLWSSRLVVPGEGEYSKRGARLRKTRNGEFTLIEFAQAPQRKTQRAPS
jgi:hypothetical protein